MRLFQRRRVATAAARYGRHTIRREQIRRGYALNARRMEGRKGACRHHDEVRHAHCLHQEAILQATCIIVNHIEFMLRTQRGRHVRHQQQEVRPPRCTKQPVLFGVGWYKSIGGASTRLSSARTVSWWCRQVGRTKMPS